MWTPGGAYPPAYRRPSIAREFPLPRRRSDPLDQPATPPRRHHGQPDLRLTVCAVSGSSHRGFLGAGAAARGGLRHVAPPKSPAGRNGSHVSAVHPGEREVAMRGSELTDVVRKLAALSLNAPKTLSPKTMNEEWTKRSLIVPLMQALGWDDPYEVLPEDLPEYSEDPIDYLLKPNLPGASSICVEQNPFYRLRRRTATTNRSRRAWSRPRKGSLTISSGPMDALGRCMRSLSAMPRFTKLILARRVMTKTRFIWPRGG